MGAPAVQRQLDRAAVRGDGLLGGHRARAPAEPRGEPQQLGSFDTGRGRELDRAGVVLGGPPRVQAGLVLAGHHQEPQRRGFEFGDLLGEAGRLREVERTDRVRCEQVCPISYGVARRGLEPPA